MMGPKMFKTFVCRSVDKLNFCYIDGRKDPLYWDTLTKLRLLWSYLWFSFSLRYIDKNAHSVLFLLKNAPFTVYVRQSVF